MTSYMSWRLGEALDEGERRLGDLPPAAVDHERVPAVGYLGDRGQGLVPLLLLVRGVRDRQRDRVVLLAVDDQERPARGVLRVDLRLGPGIQIGGGRLEERRAGRRHVVLLVEVLCLVLAKGVCPAVFALLERECDRAAPSGGLA